MQSPLAGLCEVLKEVKRRAQEYSPTNEAQTRQALINPILEALGWDLSNPDYVELEKHYTPKFIDYVLKGHNHIIIEAKKIGTDLSNDAAFDQVFAYARRSKIRDVFLTDGLVWRHYKDNEAADGREGVHFSTERKPTINLKDDNELIKAATYFITTLDAALYTPLRKEKNELSELKVRIAELEKAIRDSEIELTNLAPMLPDNDQNVPSSPWLILNDTSWEPKHKRPKQLWLPGKQIVDVNGWSQVLTKVCEFCLIADKGFVSSLPIPDKAGKSQNLVSMERPANGYSLIELEGQSLYVNTCYDALNSIRNAVYMLEKLGEGTASKAAVLLAD